MTKSDWSPFTKKVNYAKNSLWIPLIVMVIIGAILLFGISNLELKDRLLVFVTAALVIVTAITAIINTISQNKQLQTSGMIKIFELLSSQDIRKAREEVHKEYCRMKKLEKISFRNSSEPKMPEYVDMVLSSLDQVSILVLNDLVDEDLFFDAYGGMIVRDWNMLSEEISRRRTNNKKILRHFEELKIRFLERIERKNNELSSEEEKTRVEPYCIEDY